MKASRVSHENTIVLTAKYRFNSEENGLGFQSCTGEVDGAEYQPSSPVICP